MLSFCIPLLCARRHIVFGPSILGTPGGPPPTPESHGFRFKLRSRPCEAGCVRPQVPKAFKGLVGSASVSIQQPISISAEAIRQPESPAQV